MDPFSAILDGPRAREAFVLRTVLAPPWSIRIEDQSPLTVIGQVRGTAWILDGQEQVSLGPGDVALTCGSAPYVFADDPATPAQFRIDADQRCWSLTDGRGLSDEMRLGVRTWGNGATGDGRDSITLVGAYDLRSQIAPLLIGLLPRIVYIPAREWVSPVRDLLLAEVTRDTPGQAVVLDRLLDLVLIETLRQWFLAGADGTPTWWGAVDDPIIGPVLRLIQDDPAHPWTVASLARRAGQSRAAFARRFTDLVGTPPMTFLTRWRLSMAADLLSDGGPTLAAVAGQVGYATPYAFSAAFTREYGMSPSTWRRRDTAGRTSAPA